MKNFKALFVFIALAAFSCGNNETELSKELEKTKLQSSKLTEIECDVVGATLVCPGSTADYNYTFTNFTPTNIQWNVVSGNMSIASGQGTTNITLSFGSNFTGGRIEAQGTDGTNTCGWPYLDIGELTPPTNVSITQNTTSGACEGAVFSFSASGGARGESYQWEAFQGATIISGQGTSTVSVQSPQSGGFSLSATTTNACGEEIDGFTLAEFDAGCN